MNLGDQIDAQPHRIDVPGCYRKTQSATLRHQETGIRDQDASKIVSRIQFANPDA